MLSGVPAPKIKELKKRRSASKEIANSMINGRPGRKNPNDPDEGNHDKKVKRMLNKIKSFILPQTAQIRAQQKEILEEDEVPEKKEQNSFKKMVTKLGEPHDDESSTAKPG